MIFQFFVCFLRTPCVSTGGGSQRLELPCEQLTFNPDDPVHADGFADDHDHTLCLRDLLDLACLDPVLATVLTAIRHEILHGHDRGIANYNFRKKLGKGLEILLNRDRLLFESKSLIGI